MWPGPGCTTPTASGPAVRRRPAGARRAPSEEEVLDGCDAVYVCTWTAEHRRLVEAAAEARAGRLLREAAGDRPRRRQGMADAVAHAGVVNQVGLVLRRSPAFLLAAARWPTDPRRGRSMSVVFRDDQFIPIQGSTRSTWRGDATKAGAGHAARALDPRPRHARDVAGAGGRRSAPHRPNFHGLDGIEDVVRRAAALRRGATATLTRSGTTCSSARACAGSRCSASGRYTVSKGRLVRSGRMVTTGTAPSRLEGCRPDRRGRPSRARRSAIPMSCSSTPSCGASRHGRRSPTPSGPTRSRMRFTGRPQPAARLSLCRDDAADRLCVIGADGVDHSQRGL